MSVNSPVSVRDCLARAARLDSDSSRLDVELLLCEALGKSRSWLFTWPEYQLSDGEFKRFDALFQRRRSGEPVAHILGRREFWGLDLAVDASTLIPRPDTERLVELALELPLPTAAEVIDLGTGTGAIALALASEKPAWSLVGCDFSSAACALAERNRVALELDNVSILQSDWFDAVTGQRFDLVVSNPPYIDPVDPHLSEGDVRFEPRSALVAGEGGLADIRRIAEQARAVLKPGGWLLFEHGFDQGAAARELMSALGYAEVRTEQDYGGNDRVTFGVCKG